MKKQLMAVLLTVCMLLTMMSVPAAAASDNNPFTDVSADSWYYDDVQYVYEEGLMSGTDTTLFAPDVTTTRGMIVTILWRMEGSPVVSGTQFADVNADAYYANAILWASENELVLGNGDNTFSPDKEITRECMALILYRYADYAGYKMTETADLDDYADADKINSYAKEALEMLCGAGLISGMGDNMIAPQGSATRAQIAALLHRFCAMLDSAETKDEYTVTFDYNYSDKGTYKTLTVANGKTVTAPKSPSRTGYTFDGWFTKAEDGKEFDFDTEITKDITLYAQWTKRNTPTTTGSVVHSHTYTRKYEHIADSDTHKAFCTCGASKIEDCAFVSGSNTCKYCGEEYALRINGVEYATLAEAFAAAQDGDTITLLTDMLDVTDTTAIPGSSHNANIIVEADVTLDLNGKTVTFTNTNDVTAIFYVQDAALTIVDSSETESEAGTGTIEYSGTYDNQSSGAMLVWANTGATVTFESGSVERKGTDETTTQIFYALNTGKIYVTGGTFTNTQNGDAKDMFNVANSSADAMISVSGGTYNVINEHDDADENRVFIATGYAVKTNEDGTFTVEPTISNPVAKIGLNIYETLDAALEAATDGDTVTLVVDIATDKQIVVDKAITIDGDSKKITAADSFTGTAPDNKILLINNVNDAVTIQNLTLDSNNKAAGLQAYCSSNVTISNTTTQNSVGAGLIVNGSTVVAEELTANGNAWGSVNVDKGTDVATDAKFTCSDCDLQDATQIWSELKDTDVVVDSDNSYNVYESADFGDFYVWSTKTVKDIVTQSGITSVTMITDQTVESLTVPTGVTLVVPSDVTLTVNGDVSGTIVDDEGNELIYSATQLTAFAVAVNGGNNYSGKTVKLMASIDLGGEEWSPIGSKDNPFSGTFDGGNNTISNLKITDGGECVGLFGKCDTGSSIKNVKVNTAELSGNHYIGGIVGYIRGSVKNCHVDGLTITCTPNEPGEVSGDQYNNGDKVGGIVGWFDRGEISNCSVTNATMSAYRDIGGIVGCLKGAVKNNTVSNTTITLDVTNAYSTPSGNAGAIYGRINGEEGKYTIDGNTATNVKVFLSDGFAALSDGTYEISTANGMFYFAQTVNNGNTYAGKTVLLTDSINLENKAWTPIGLNADDANKFKGIFDGQYKTISNLTVETETGYTAAGLFGALNGTAKNFTIENAIIKHISKGNADDYTSNGIAVVAGSLYPVGAVDKVTVKNATVEGNRYMGAITGYTYGSVTNCTVENVTLTAVPDDAVTSGTYNNGDKVGGIAGYFASESTYTISGNTVTDVTIKGYRDLGGIIGASDDKGQSNAVTDNTVDGLNITVDQVTNFYEEKAANAAAIIGRIVNGSVDNSNTATDVSIETK